MFCLYVFGGCAGGFWLVDVGWRCWVGASWWVVWVVAGVVHGGVLVGWLLVNGGPVGAGVVASWSVMRWVGECVVGM